MLSSTTKVVLYICQQAELGTGIPGYDMMGLEKEFNVCFVSHGTALLAKTCVLWSDPDSD